MTQEPHVIAERIAAVIQEAELDGTWDQIKAQLQQKVQAQLLEWVTCEADLSAADGAIDNAEADIALRTKVWYLFVTCATAGAVPFTVAGQTASLPYNCSAASATTLVNALTTVDPGDIVWTGGPLNSVTGGTLLSPPLVATLRDDYRPTIVSGPGTLVGTQVDDSPLVVVAPYTELARDTLEADACSKQAKLVNLDLAIKIVEELIRDHVGSVTNPTQGQIEEKTAVETLLTRYGYPVPVL